MTLQTTMQTLGARAKNAAKQLAIMPTETKNKALIFMADAIEDAIDQLLELNSKEVGIAKSLQLNEAFIDRLTLTEPMIISMASGLRSIAELDDPIGTELASWQVPSGLTISRVSMPLGVIGVIYESRPNVTADAAALCFKAGNTVILRGGSECVETNLAIVECLQLGLRQAGCSVDAIQMVPTQERQAVGMLLTMDEFVDVIVPRGGKSLIKRVINESRIPLFQHLDGICHTYIHQDAELNMAKSIIHNAKLRQPGICGATETVLLDEAIAEEFLPSILNDLFDADCEVRGDDRVCSMDARVVLATFDDWSTEYLDKIISIKVVQDLDKAIDHIAHFSSMHTDAIVTDNDEAADQFMLRLNSSILMHNASTQFADGGEFGMGAEIGISTGKLHARGPVGVEQLTTFKYLVKGQGQTRP